VFVLPFSDPVVFADDDDDSGKADSGILLYFFKISFFICLKLLNRK